MSERTPGRRAEGGIRDDLDVLLRDRPTDEKNGANASLGFTFQQWWAALSIAELLRNEDDFAVGVEVKEDVAILDSAQTPTKVEFCQIKKHERDGVWILKDLHKKGTKRQDGTHEHSILAKLYARRKEFGSSRARLRFVSNLGVKLPDEAGGASLATNADLSSLATEQQLPIKQAIATQLGCSDQEIDLAGILVHKTNLPLGEPEIFVGGKLEQLSSTGLLPFQLSHTSVAARVLASEVQSRASSTTYARSFDELKFRIISRSQALDILAKVAASKAPVSEVLDEATAELDREGHPFVERKDIKAQRVRVCADASDRTNMIFRGIANSLQQARFPVEAAIGARATLGELMNEVVEQARALSPAEFSGLPLPYIRAVALLVLHDAIDFNILTAPASPESKEKQ
ncbi:dsDNA nuclease domain-containing protein [Chitinimonas sp.]|uniref:dsDNA nuclease domain-containing protein n=1 Tax=Chitinimonas sp. TaxID=1934313 RepID=UPI0035B08DDB